MLKKMYLEDVSEARNSRSHEQRSTQMRSKSLDFQFYWNALNKSKWPIAIVTAVVTAAAAYYAITTKPIYAASATLLLESQRANITTIEDLVSSEQESLDYFGTQYAVLRSRALAERVVRKLDNTQDSRFAHTLGMGEITSSNTGVDQTEPTQASAATSQRYTNAEFNEILSRFRKSLSINPVVKTKLVTVNFESTDPAFAAEAANTMASEYIASVSEQRNAIKNQASAWMDNRISELRVELEQSEEDLLSFKKTNGLVDLSGDVSRLNEQELLQTSAELAGANSELSNARDLFRKVQEFKASEPRLLKTLPFVQTDVLVRSVETEIGQAQRDLLELNNRFGPKHPVMRDAQARLSSLNSTLDSHIARTVATFENDYQLLIQRVNSLSSNIASGKENIQVIGEQKIVLESLERKVDATREQYTALFERITETRATAGLDDANALLTEPAWIPTEPVKPNKALIVAIALIGSLLLMSVICVVREFLNNTVSSMKDVEQRLNTKVLGVLPLVKSGFLRGKTELPLTPTDVADTSETFTEAVNTCRTAISIKSRREASEGSPLQVILVTSSVPDEGKSTVAMNLAASFGKLERTLLIDCDLRKPSVARALGMNTDTVGLSSLLMNKAEVDECVRSEVLGSFDCLPSGPISDLPLEMLASSRFAVTLRALRKYYDKIIIDSAPTHVVSDALVLSKLSDGVLYVVKPHKTPIKLVHNGLTSLKEAKASVLGVCVTQVNLDKTKAFDGLEFHGFGVNYHGYGSHYLTDEATAKTAMTRFRSDKKAA